MDSFGVVSQKLKALAKKVQIPAIISLDKTGADETIDFIGAKIKNLNTAGDRSATGIDDTRGVLVLDVVSGSGASEFLQTNDVILSLNNKKTNNLRDLQEARMSVIGTITEIVVFRNQEEAKKLIELEDKN
jgi:S1-C subfamily serine protease